MLKMTLDPLMHGDTCHTPTSPIQFHTLTHSHPNTPSLYVSHKQREREQNSEAQRVCFYGSHPMSPFYRICQAIGKRRDRRKSYQRESEK